MYVSALAQRRVYLEGWGYALRSAQIGSEAVARGRRQPFPRRFATNEAVFRRGDRAALNVLRRRGVGLLVAIRDAGGRTADLRRLGRAVFANAGVVIYRVGPDR